MVKRTLSTLNGCMLIVLVGCSNGGGTRDTDMTDVAEEAQGDATVDSSAETMIDGGADTRPDTVEDVAADGLTDSPSDAPGDGTGDEAGDVPIEAGVDVPADVPADVSTEVAYPNVNGCTRDSAEDHTGQPSVTVAFGGAIGMAYSPPCLVVSTGTKVVFEGAFSFHPLRGGEAGAPDDASPFEPATTTGSTAEFTLHAPGTYAFYCGVHWSLGMKGAVYVE